MSGEKVIYRVTDQGIAELTINRPEVRNAFDDATIAALLDCLRQAAGDGNVRLLLLKSSGDVFSAGADVRWMKHMVKFDYQTNLADAAQLAQLLSALDQFPTPTLAMVQGPAMGGGLGLIACCDIAVASDSCRFGFTEVKLGLSPATIAPYIIRAIGERLSRRLFLTGELFSAQQAKDYGLLHEVVTAEQLEPTCQQLCQQLINNAPQALQETKALLLDLRDMSDFNRYKQRTIELISRLRVSNEGQEGLAAFLEKRRPNWKNHGGD